jgi:uncharacterized protein
MNLNYRAPAWLGGKGALGGHLQTLWPAVLARRHIGPAPRWRRERWATPDGDFIDTDFLETDTPRSPQAPCLVLFHGLEGSVRSHYAQAFAHQARTLGWHMALPHFRGCSGELNLAPRAYHSGDFEEVGWILGEMRRRHAGPLCAAGVSLGGNALLCWAEEAGESARGTLRALAALSAPVDLAAAGHAIGLGLNRQIYTRVFLRTMKPKALAKLAQFPGLFNRARLLAAEDLYSFDDAFTAPLHGFRDVNDYWSRASSKPRLADIRVPTLVVNARNDPFVPASSLPRMREVGGSVTLAQPGTGGHAGFPGGHFPGHVLSAPRGITEWMGRFL